MSASCWTRKSSPTTARTRGKPLNATGQLTEVRMHRRLFLGSIIGAAVQKSIVDQILYLKNRGF